jgi:LysR family transcriptional regulator, cyn operon transcriptional activator
MKGIVRTNGGNAAAEDVLYGRQVSEFSKAGRILGLSQPTVNQQIHALEQELAVPLLVRSYNVVRLTPAGEIVLQCAQHVIQNLERARRLADCSPKFEFSHRRRRVFGAKASSMRT